MLRAMMAPFSLLFLFPLSTWFSHVQARSLRLGKSSEIVSKGEIRFRYRPLYLPPEVKNNIQDGHGLVLNPGTSDYFFTFNPKNSTGQVLVWFPQFGVPQIFGSSPFLSGGVPHGLRMGEEAGKGKFLYHANNEQRVTKTTLHGDVVWSVDLSYWKTLHPGYWPIRPTDAILVPNIDMLLVADGYGSHFVHAFNATNGHFIEGLSFGGYGNSTKPLRFSTPHSISLDNSATEEQEPQFIISDRANHRLVWVTPKGELIRIKTLVETHTTLPCNVDNSFVDVRSKKRLMAIPSLGHSTGNLVNGSVTILDEASNTVVSKIEVAQLLGKKGHQHPHDAIFLPNGDLVVCCWSGPANPNQGPANGTISYWERLDLVET